MCRSWKKLILLQLRWEFMKGSNQERAMINLYFKKIALGIWSLDYEGGVTGRPSGGCWWKQ